MRPAAGFSSRKCQADLPLAPQAIVNAIADGQVKRAGALMVEHIQSFGDAAVRRLTRR